MRGRFIAQLSAILAFCSLAAAAHATGGHVDHGTQDLYPACNRPAAYPRATLRQDRQNAVFSVWVTRPGSLQRTGTASLIDDTGIFITAGHVVHFDKTRAIKIKQKPAGAAQEYEYDVDLISSSDNFQKEDFVLLRAREWRNDSRFPYPLRFDDTNLADAAFIGFEEQQDQPAHKPVSYYTADEFATKYQGVAFGHSSGALLYDAFGRAFGVLVKHSQLTIDSTSGLPPERLFEEWNKRATNSAFSLEKALPVLKASLPPSFYMAKLIDELSAKSDPQSVPGDMNSRATALDMIHLIDATLFGRIGPVWSLNVPAMGALSQRIQVAADALCVSSYYHNAIARLMSQRSGSSSAAGTPTPQIQPPPTPAAPAGEQRPPPSGSDATQKASIESIERTVVDQLGTGSLEDASRLGASFLTHALAASRNGSDLAASHVRLALRLLRDAARRPEVSRALLAGTRNRDYAALAGNLALAEDLGTDYRLGSKQGARQAILAADALGGSSSGYELAARYALAESDPASAAGLYARSFAMLGSDSPRERAIRSDLTQGFRNAIASTGLPANSEIAQFDPSRLPRQPDSLWHALASRQPGNFEFQGTRIARASTGGGPETIKVGVLHSLSGSFAISETTLKDTMLFLVDEQNKKGGVLGRKLEAVVVDPASNWPLFAEKARELISKDKVAVVFGGFTSVSRKSVLPVFKELNSILFYPVQYEGEESERNVFYTGATPNQQAIPAVDYLAREEKVQRWVLAGTDYVYPRTINKILESYLISKEVKKEDIMINYTPFGYSDWQTIVSDIKKFGSAGKKTAVISTINGAANIPFYRELSHQGIKATAIPVVALSIGEEELAGLDTKPLLGHLAARSYFQSVRDKGNDEFIAKWKAFTKDPKRVITDPMEAHVIGFAMWVKAVEAAKTTDPDKVIDALPGIKAPNLTGGISEMLPNHHITKPAFIGEIKGDGQFDVVWKSPGLVPGDAWSAFLPDSKPLEADWVKLKCGNYNTVTKKCGGAL
jgi:urea transport system substrate-binding protein